MRTLELLFAIIGAGSIAATVFFLALMIRVARRRPDLRAQVRAASRAHRASRAGRARPPARLDEELRSYPRRTGGPIDGSAP